jgi:hypothetical protein
MSALNPAELAAFADLVYKNTIDDGYFPARLPQGFKLIEVPFTTTGGFYASAFYRASTGDLVVAYRGSNDIPDWVFAYWYARNGGFTGIGLNSAQASIGAPGFGSDAQSLHAFSGLQEGLVKLS